MAAINVAAVAPVAPVHARGRPSRSYRKQYRTVRERDGPLRHIVVALRRLGQIERFPFEHRGTAADRNTAASIHSPSLVVAILQPECRAAVVVNVNPQNCYPISEAPNLGSSISFSL